MLVVYLTSISLIKFQMAINGKTIDWQGIWLCSNQLNIPMKVLLCRGRRSAGNYRKQQEHPEATETLQEDVCWCYRSCSWERRFTCNWNFLQGSRRGLWLIILQCCLSSYIISKKYFGNEIQKPNLDVR